MGFYGMLTGRQVSTCWCVWERGRGCGQTGVMLQRVLRWVRRPKHREGATGYDGGNLGFETPQLRCLFGHVKHNCFRLQFSHLHQLYRVGVQVIRNSVGRASYTAGGLIDFIPRTVWEDQEEKRLGVQVLWKREPPNRQGQAAPNPLLPS